MKTNQLPHTMNTANQLPEPDLGYIKTDISNQPAFSARQMRETMKHALQARAQVHPAQAGVTDERQAFEACEVMAGSLFKRRADDPEKYWDGNVQDDWELWQARAILALRPVQVPMTDLPEGDVTYFDGRGDAVDGYTAERVWEILRSHGITAQAQKGGAA